MTSRDFCYWLQGFFEVASPNNLSSRQTQLVKNHLAMVFIHEIDPEADFRELVDDSYSLFIRIPMVEF